MYQYQSTNIIYFAITPHGDESRMKERGFDESPGESDMRGNQLKFQLRTYNHYPPQLTKTETQVSARHRR